MSQLAQQLNKPFRDFILRIFRRHTSSFIIVFGRRESGKTDFSLLILEILYGDGWKHFASNITVESIIPIKFITNLDDLILWCKETKGRKLFILDEMGKTFRRRTPMSRLNIKIADQLQILRKYKLSIIGVTPSPEFVDRIALREDMLDGIFIKPWTYENPRENQKLALYKDNIRGTSQPFYNIPGTSLQFDTWGTAPFTLHGPLTKPKFRDKDLSYLWDWSHGMRIKDLPISRVYFLEIKKKFIKEVLERDVSK